jgi:hypothetical protein
LGFEKGAGLFVRSDQGIEAVAEDRISDTSLVQKGPASRTRRELDRRAKQRLFAVMSR